MENFNEAAYWITLAHIPKWSNEKKNNLLIDIFNNNGKTLSDFFSCSGEELIGVYKLSIEDVQDISNAVKSLPSNSFIAENLSRQGVSIIPVVSGEYSGTLKKNLKTKFSPPVLYVKGNKKILNEKSVAIVGSRNASEISLLFTDNIARKASEQFKVVVSGFAKGVDKQALDSALKYNGQSIIVLPQGILTFDSGMKKYYTQIIEGNVLVLSTFHPNAVWSVPLAMGRNPIIYGLADEIYAAQSDEKGGTWAGVLDGLKKGRRIFIRKPDSSEQIANNILIEKGGVPVDVSGNLIGTENKVAEKEKEQYAAIHENQEDNVEVKIFLELSRRELTAAQLKTSLQIEWPVKRLSAFLKKMENIEVLKGRPQKFRAKKDNEPDLFSNSVSS